MQELADQKSISTNDGWPRLVPEFGTGPGRRASIGLLALATDRVGALDTEDFLPVEGVAVFSTRVPMSPVATPESLRAMGDHLEEATRLLVPGSKLDVVGFSCTSGTIAIGEDKVREAICAACPTSHVTTPIRAGITALRRLGARRISLLVPYLVPTAQLVCDFFEDGGFTIERRATFDLRGDPEMNLLSPEALISGAMQIDTEESDAVFISCTGLQTRNVVAEAERRLGKPVVTSNQALAWHSLRLAKVEDRLPDRGSLFELSLP
jgi:maleate isomerase